MGTPPIVGTYKALGGLLFGSQSSGSYDEIKTINEIEQDHWGWSTDLIRTVAYYQSTLPGGAIGGIGD